MPKVKLEDILKPGATLGDVKIIDYSTPEQQERLKAMRKQAEQALKNKRVNWERLSRMYITI